MDYFAIVRGCLGVGDNMPIHQRISTAVTLNNQDHVPQQMEYQEEAVELLCSFLRMNAVAGLLSERRQTRQVNHLFLDVPRDV